MTCSLCGRGADDVGKLIRAPAAAICDACTAVARSSLTDHELDMPCSFCGNAEGARQCRVGRLAICESCVEACTDVLREARVTLPEARVVKK
jgi:ATP-dependent protease Clp ATPase subunit